ncbi:MAG: OmpA family protein, partial [Granulosicoccus sp.]
SRERAVAVRNALVSAGISGARIATKGFGETLPVANNASPSGRQENRRVEIIFPDDDTQVSEFEH